jgi:hypothetical protein
MAAYGLFLVMHMVMVPSSHDSSTLHYYLDSGASGYYVPDIESLHSFRIYTNLKNIQTMNGAYVLVKGARTLKFYATDQGQEFVGEVPNVE